MYKFKTTEQTNDKATEFETKSLLYLLTKIKGCSGISLFIIDCFNDVTGISEDYTDSWDVQAKNIASLTPRKVGKALYTLFANYVSDIPFGHFILYLPPLKEQYVENPFAEVFDITNFKSQKVADIKAGLLAEIMRRNDSDVNTHEVPTKVDCFLSIAIFVFDRYNKSDYIKAIIKFRSLTYLDDVFFTRIFDEVRIQQASKKIKNVNGLEVASIKETEKLEKNLYRKDIELLVINRIIGNDLFSANGVPLYFIPETHGMDIEDIADIIQDCQAKISKTLFNKNNKRAFWSLLEEILICIEENPSIDIRVVLSKISDVVKQSLFTMDDCAILYLIAVVKEGLHNENH